MKKSGHASRTSSFSGEACSEEPFGASCTIAKPPVARHSNKAGDKANQTRTSMVPPCGPNIS
jgi:hypothetical protein